MNIKRYIVAGAAAATLAGGAFAFAANLDVDSDTLASGSSSTDSDCDSIAVDWAPAYDNALHAYLVDEIVVTGDDACVGETVELAIELDGTPTTSEELEGVEFVDVEGTATAKFTDLDFDANDLLHVTAIATGEDVVA